MTQHEIIAKIQELHSGSVIPKCYLQVSYGVRISVEDQGAHWPQGNRRALKNSGHLPLQMLPHICVSGPRGPSAGDLEVNYTSTLSSK